MYEGLRTIRGSEVSRRFMRVRLEPPSASPQIFQTLNMRIVCTGLAALKALG